MKLDIRPATLKDTEMILEYYKDLLAEKLPFIFANPVPTMAQEKEFVRSHDGVRAVLFIAEHEGQVVGISGYHIAEHPQLAHNCSLAISVARLYRRQGIGSELIHAGEEWCRSKSIQRLDLEVIEGNSAVKFYQELGYVIEGRKHGAFRAGDKFRDIIIMAKSLA